MIDFTASSETVVAVCSLLGLFLVTLVVLTRRRTSPSTVDVDDFHLEKQSTKSNSTKKIKQKKVKTTSAASESSSNSTQTKVTMKQSPVKNASKEKQTDEKKKPVPKKASTSANASSQRVQQNAETLGDWSIAVSKKKQKTKKTDSSAENLKASVPSNGPLINDPKTADPKEIGGKFPCDKTTQNVVLQKHNKSLVDKKKSDDETGALLFEPHQDGTMLDQIVAEGSQQPVELLSPSALESGEGDLAAIHSAEKSKKTSKKKKSKLTTEITQPSAASDTQDGKKSANSSLMANIDPQTKNAKPLPDDASAGLASSENVSNCEVAVVQDDAARLPKDLPKAKNARLLKEISESHSENKSPVAISASSKDKMADKETSELVSSSVPDISVAVSGSNSAMNVASVPLKDVASSPLPSQIVFDELGLKDGDLSSTQPALKKKKKIRKDV